jgi:D-3-phosphoglycerate dehydrogenase
MEVGTIRHSVNFPSTSLPERPERSIRITVVNKNIPGMLAHITDIFGKHNLNILQQINQSRGDIAYNVLDIDPIISDGSTANLGMVQREITTLEGVLSSRILFGTPGAGYARNIDGKFYV